MDLRLIGACAMLCVLTACAQGQSNNIVAEGESPVRVADSYSFTEGPAADAKGDVYTLKMLVHGVKLASILSLNRPRSSAPRTAFTTVLISS